MTNIEDIRCIDDLQNFISSGDRLAMGSEARMAVRASCDYIREKAYSGKPIYGVNTGFGSLYDRVVGADDLGQLQYNLLRSHACGTGDAVPAHLIRLMLLLKIKSLAYGYSGVQDETIDLLIAFYNLDILPYVYTQGSLGASGDLAPLSHLALPLTGEGKVWWKGEVKEAAEVLKQNGLKPVALGPKEGLALINGTQFMLAYGVHAVTEAGKIIANSSCIAALSMEAFNARTEPFLPFTHLIRNQPGQQRIASEILGLLEGSKLADAPGKRVQDPYSFRCIPQVHGASVDALDYVKKVMENEVNAVTDNPNIFRAEDLIISGGNFHGQTLALSMDFAAMALAELASISERRIYKLIAGENGLPAYLAENPGLESGYMIAQYTAASIVSQNKQLCTPASVDSIVSSNGQEDHVSMGANAAVKLAQVIENVQQVLAIEMLVASRALSFKNNVNTSARLKAFLDAFRSQLPVHGGDTILSPLLLKAKDWLFKR